MKILEMPDWQELFSPDRPLLESFIRGTVMYLFIFFFLRILPKRQAGEMSMTDMVLVVLIAEAASQSMIGESYSLPNGIVLVSTLLFWNFILHFLSVRSHFFERVVHAKPIMLIKDGKMLKVNMHREMISEELLQSEIREQGIGDIKQIKEARIEGDGKLSFIKVDEEKE